MADNSELTNLLDEFLASGGEPDDEPDDKRRRFIVSFRRNEQRKPVVVEARYFTCDGKTYAFFDHDAEETYPIQVVEVFEDGSFGAVSGLDDEEVEVRLVRSFPMAVVVDVVEVGKQ